MTIFIGIDPGLNGGIAIMDSGGIISTRVMPTITIEKGGKKRRTYNLKELRAIFSVCDSSHTYTTIEEQFPMPQQGIVSMFSIGYGIGLIQGLFVGLDLSFSVIHPKIWQKEYGIKGGDTKEQALKVCQDLFSNVNLLPTKRTKSPHKGIVDALLIMEYGRRKKLEAEGGVKNEIIR